MLFYLEDREYDETEATELKAYHLAYRDARKELQKRKNERGYVRHGQHRDRDPGRPKGGKKGARKPHFAKSRGKGKFKTRRSSTSRPLKGNEEDLESRTRCWNCNELGHFAKNCPLSQPRGDGQGGPPRQQFVVHTGHATPGVPTMQFMMTVGTAPEKRQGDSQSSLAFNATQMKLWLTPQLKRQSSEQEPSNPWREA